jgi:hypothetical protein
LRAEFAKGQTFATFKQFSFGCGVHGNSVGSGDLGIYSTWAVLGQSAKLQSRATDHNSPDLVPLLHHPMSGQITVKNIGTRSAGPSKLLDCQKMEAVTQMCSCPDLPLPPGPLISIRHFPTTRPSTSLRSPLERRSLIRCLSGTCPNGRRGSTGSPPSSMRAMPYSQATRKTTSLPALS